MDKPKLRFAVIGCGHIGKRHIAMIQQNPDAELIAYADIKQPELTDELLTGAKYFSSLDELLSGDIAENIEVITIATPNYLHAPMALKALEAKKHVVLEKPMTISKSDAEQIVFRSINVQRHVFVVKQNRYSPPAVWLKSLMEKNIPGKIFIVQLNCFWNRDEHYYTSESWHGSKQMDGGILYTQFSHFIDILFWIFGDIKNIHARMNNYRKLKHVEFEDCGTAQFEFLQGGIGSINFSTAVWDKNMESSMTIIAENGSIKIGGQYMNTVEYCHIKNYVMPVLSKTNVLNEYGAYQGSAANHQYIFQNVINVIRNNGSITANVMEGMKVVDIIERIYTAAASNTQTFSNASNFIT